MAYTGTYAELKARQSVMWGNGPFDRIAESIVDLHTAVADALDPQQGERVLDLGCGTGRVAEQLAGRGATVVGVDLSPALIETAQERAQERGLSIDYRVGDAEHLELEDASFDAAGSSAGDHVRPEPRGGRLRAGARRTARRTDRPRELDTRSRHRRAVPDDGTLPGRAASVEPVRLGRRQKVRALLGDAFELGFRTRVNAVAYPSAEDYWQEMSQNYGPTRTLHESLGERGEELHQAWLAFFDTDEFRRDDGFVQEREYLLVTGRRC